MRFTIDHIVPSVLGGSDDPDNLCLACWDCNLTKGSRTTATDPDTRNVISLFHPRKKKWQDHFEWDDTGTSVGGRTATGRATVEALELNRTELVRARLRWVAAGWHPPEAQV